MQLFTIKDFINYNNPCFICNCKIDLKVVVNTKNINAYKYMIPEYHNDKLIVILTNSYKDKVSFLLHLNTNQFECDENLFEFLKEHSIYLQLSCSCLMTVKSKNIVFDFDNMVIIPTSLFHEEITFKYKEMTIWVDSDFILNKTSIRIFNKQNTYKEINKIINLMPKSSFANKEELIKKMKWFLTYA
jgi:hypothetical protein